MSGKTKRTVSAGMIIYRKTERGVLFLLLYHGGQYWNFPKGKIEENENLRETAAREIIEETGLTKNDLVFQPRFRTHDRFTFTKSGEKVSKRVTYFLARAKRAEIRISTREHQGYCWFTYKEARRMLIHRNLKENLKKAYDTIQGKKEK